MTSLSHFETEFKAASVEPDMFITGSNEVDSFTLLIDLGFIEMVITSVTESLIEVISGFTEVVSAVVNDNSGSVEVFTNSVKESANVVMSGWIEVASSVVINSSSSEVAINFVKESAVDGIS